MNMRPFVVAAAIVASVAASTPHAYAQVQSNYSVYQVVGDLGTAIQTLQRDQADYGGHRVRAIGHLRRAQRQLEASLNFAQAHNYAMPAGGAPHYDYPAWDRNNQSSSDQSLVMAQQHAQTWIGQLQADGADYGGHRMKAINAIAEAQQELGMAVGYAHAHGY
jgi:hypothetical protein